MITVKWIQASVCKKVPLLSLKSNSIVSWNEISLSSLNKSSDCDRNTSTVLVSWQHVWPSRITKQTSFQCSNFLYQDFLKQNKQNPFIRINHLQPYFPEQRTMVLFFIFPESSCFSVFQMKSCQNTKVYYYACTLTQKLGWKEPHQSERCQHCVSLISSSTCVSCLFLAHNPTTANNRSEW